MGKHCVQKGQRNHLCPLLQTCTRGACVELTPPKTSCPFVVLGPQGLFVERRLRGARKIRQSIWHAEAPPTLYCRERTRRKAVREFTPTLPRQQTPVQPTLFNSTV